jgi:transporter family-2 protein
MSTKNIPNTPKELHMEAGLRFGLIAALIAGGMFAIIVTLEGAISKVVGAINASILEHLFGGSIAFVLFGILLISRRINYGTVKPVLPMSAILGVLVFAAVAVVAFAVPRTGVALGNFAVVFGQLLLAVLIDTIGVGGLERLPLTPQRIIGLLVMIAGIYLVFPKQG